MQIVKTTDPKAKPSVIMLCYGSGGVGKTTFAATAPKPLIVDCENGAKYFGLRGIEVDVANVRDWSDMKGLFDIAKSGEYETIIIDPIGELMEKLKRFMVAMGDKKLVQSDGSPSMAGWGWLKDTMRSTIKVLRDSGCHLILVAHVDEKGDEDKLVKRPMIMTKLSDELVNMVDIVGYMTVIQTDGEDKRIIIVDPTNDKYVAKDRTGQLGKYIPPNFSEIVNACQGTEKYAWSAQEAKTTPEVAETAPETTKAPETPESTDGVKKDAVSAKLAKAGAKKVAAKEPETK
jgi:phage nucleotide-binding protein